MYLQDFLRQNNTGKLLWQVFGVQAATLCLYGIAEHEEMMWDALKLAGFHLFLNLFTNLTLYLDEIALDSRVCPSMSLEAIQECY